jgi:DNA-directed RNA polymerase specialized sigma24 family protein
MSNALSCPATPDSRFDMISTHLHLLHCPHELVLRYRKAIRQYLGALLRDEHDADDVAQMVVQDMLRGKFGQWDPGKGRFRDYLKKAVRHAGLAHLRQKQRRAGPPPATAACSQGTPDAVWIVSWRAAILDDALEALRAYERRHRDNVFYTVLRLRADHPRDRSEQLAARLAETTGRPFTAANARKQLERARGLLARLLVQAVKRLVPHPTPEEVQEELIDLGLIDYVGGHLPPG